MSTLFELTNIAFAYPDSPPVFSRVSLTIPAGTFVLLRGDSGTGKSTFLRLFNGLNLPTQGRILYKGKPLTAYSPPQLRSSIAMVPQTPAVIADTVRANLLLPFTFTGWKSRPELSVPTDVQLRSLLATFRLDSISLDKQAPALSAGQKQRLCCIRAMLLKPEVLLMDEPTSGLDKTSRAIVEHAVAEAQDRHGTTVLYISHQDMTCDSLSCPSTINMENGTATYHDAGEDYE